MNTHTHACTLILHIHTLSYNDITYTYTHSCTLILQIHTHYHTVILQIYTRTPVCSYYINTHAPYIAYRLHMHFPTQSYNKHTHAHAHTPFHYIANIHCMLILQRKLCVFNRISCLNSLAN